VEPSTVDLGTETQMTGTGTLDKAVSGGTYLIEAKAAGIIDQKFTGNNCEAKTFNLPLGVGSISWDGLTCPQAAGSMSIGFKVELSAAIPASLAEATIAMTAVDQDSESLLCVNVQTKAAFEEQGVSCDSAACPSICECANSKCGSAIDACLADSTCASAQSCVLACECGDTACAAQCAAGAGSAATAVLGCLTSSCSGEEEQGIVAIVQLVLPSVSARTPIAEAQSMLAWQILHVLQPRAASWHAHAATLLVQPNALPAQDPQRLLSWDASQPAAVANPFSKSELVIFFCIHLYFWRWKIPLW